MATHFLIDQFGDTTSITPRGIGTAAILDAIDTPTGMSPLNGSFVVRVPDGLPVQKPVDLGDLLTKKYLALLAYYANFTQVAFDPMMDAANIDLGTSKPGKYGERSSIQLKGGGYVTSTMVTLVGPAPAQCLITWEAFTIAQTDILNSSVRRTYQEVPSDVSTSLCDVSFNNGVTWLAANDGQVLSVPIPARGTQFLIRLYNNLLTPLNIGSWALVY